MLTNFLVAHRGYQQHYPENTLLAFRKAIEAGARFIETDIQFSADGIPVLYHDLAMKRLSGIDNLVSNLSFAELSELTAHEPSRWGEQFAGEALPSLQQLVELLQEYPEVTVFVEAKCSAVEIAGCAQAFDRLAACLAPIRDRAVLISFDYTFMAHANKHGYARRGVVLHHWADLDSEAVRAVAPEFIFCDGEKLPAQGSVATADATLIIYEVGSAKQAIALFERGVDMVETFNIGGLIQSLGRHTL